MNNKIKKLMSRLYKQVKGFTLIELLIVIAIIGVLSALLMANFIGIRQRARDAQRKADLRQIQSALELYRSDNGSYPSYAGGTIPTSPLVSCSGKFGNAACTTTYMQKVPDDPLGGSAHYYYSSGGTLYYLLACLENKSDKEIDTSTNSCGSNNDYRLSSP